MFVNKILSFLNCLSINYIGNDYQAKYLLKIKNFHSVLVANIEEKTKQEAYFHPFSKNTHGAVLLYYACLYGFLPIVEYLVEKGANIEAKENEQ